jgi:hypothetical protein
MPKKNKQQASCKACNTIDGLYVTLKNGERLPSYVLKIGDGIYCNTCAKAAA